MTTDQNIMLYAKLPGFRLVVLANRTGCYSEFSRALHDRLIKGLEAAIGCVRIIMAVERSVLTGGDEFADYQLEGEAEIFGRLTTTCWTISNSTRTNIASTAAIGPSL